uniref:Uncharacterized protein n=1 Tax=Anguilla anguilla TaxID=7936 RepID=A0A0E9VKC4_ANGAN
MWYHHPLLFMLQPTDRACTDLSRRKMLCVQLWHEDSKSTSRGH